jgi:carbonic anhydrase
LPNPLQRLLDGFEQFHTEHFASDDPLMTALRQGQKPQVLVIGCSDSRVDPAIVTRARPGDLFIVRNIAAIVPPYKPEGVPKSTSAAVEFGVRGLEVSHIVVMGHANCGGMRLLAERGEPGSAAQQFEFVDDWVETAAAARHAVARAGLAAIDHAPLLERAGVLVSLANLLTFPWIRSAVAGRELALHGWYFDLGAGELLAFDAPSHRFLPARGHARPLIGQEALEPEALDLSRLMTFSAETG